MRDELCTNTLRASVQKFLAIFRVVARAVRSELHCPTRRHLLFAHVRFFSARSVARLRPRARWHGCALVGGRSCGGGREEVREVREGGYSEWCVRVCLGRVCVRLRGAGGRARARALPGGGEQHPAAQQAARGVQLPPLLVRLLTTFDPRRMGVKRRLGGH